jgi:D-alanine-D-alanine ligase-like ATP-grasp enzyme
MDWGAVDMGLTSRGEVVILEVNSAPGIDEGSRTLQLYADAIKERVNG